MELERRPCISLTGISDASLESTPSSTPTWITILPRIDCNRSSSFSQFDKMTSGPFSRFQSLKVLLSNEMHIDLYSHVQTRRVIPALSDLRMSPSPESMLSHTVPHCFRLEPRSDFQKPPFLQTFKEKEGADSSYLLPASNLKQTFAPRLSCFFPSFKARPLHIPHSLAVPRECPF